jgi:hypothetical protein
MLTAWQLTDARRVNLYERFYDFRLPTVERLQKTFWNSEDARILVPQAFGVGWTINFYPLIHPRPVR